MKIDSKDHPSTGDKKPKRSKPKLIPTESFRSAIRPKPQLPATAPLFPETETLGLYPEDLKNWERNIDREKSEYLFHCVIDRMKTPGMKGDAELWERRYKDVRRALIALIAAGRREKEFPGSRVGARLSSGMDAKNWGTGLTLRILRDRHLIEVVENAVTPASGRKGQLTAWQFVEPDKALRFECGQNPLGTLDEWTGRRLTHDEAHDAEAKRIADDEQRFDKKD